MHIKVALKRHLTQHIILSVRHGIWNLDIALINGIPFGQRLRFPSKFQVRTLECVVSTQRTY